MHVSLSLGYSFLRVILSHAKESTGGNAQHFYLPTPWVEDRMRLGRKVKGDISRMRDEGVRHGQIRLTLRGLTLQDVVRLVFVDV